QCKQCCARTCCQHDSEHCAHAALCSGIRLIRHRVDRLVCALSRILDRRILDIRSVDLFLDQFVHCRIQCRHSCIYFFLCSILFAHHCFCFFQRSFYILCAVRGVQTQIKAVCSIDRSFKRRFIRFRSCAQTSLTQDPRSF